MVPESCKGTIVLTAEVNWPELGGVVEAPSGFECRYDLGVRRLFQPAANQSFGIRLRQYRDVSRLQ